jgi:hypothetical protein
MLKNIVVVVGKVWERCEVARKAVGKTKVWVELGNVIQAEGVGYTQVIRRGVDEIGLMFS